MSHDSKTWLEQRTLTHRLPVPISGLLNLALLLVLGQVIWYVFFSPNGLVQLYTPNVGLVLVTTCLMVIHWFNDVADFNPCSRTWLRKTSAPVKGLTLTAAVLFTALIIMLVVYNQIIGRFGAIFFSGQALLASGGLGQYAQTARENAYYAQNMMNSTIIFCTILWVTGAHYSPWSKCEKKLAAGSVMLMGAFLAVIVFAVLYYPHIAYQFYPPQIFMAAQPWWSDFAMTQSSLFHFGWMVPALVLLYWINMLWEGAPFKSIKNNAVRFCATAVFVIAAGIVLEQVANNIMTWYWEVDAYEGGMTIEQPAWRWNHVAELALMMAVCGAILFHYFDNWPKNINCLPVRAAIRTAIAVGGGLVLAWCYWEFGSYFLGTVYGLGQENDTSNVWTILHLCLINVHMLFFDGFPLRKLA